jgi:hypothetical protein
MPTAWEQMGASEKLKTLRSELTALSRVTASVSRRIEAMGNELNAIGSAVGVSKEPSGARGPTGGVTDRVQDDKNLVRLTRYKISSSQPP